LGGILVLVANVFYVLCFSVLGSLEDYAADAALFGEQLQGVSRYINDITD
jgi:hypothetical protein